MEQESFAMNKVVFRLIVAAPLMFAPAAALAGNPVDNYAANALSSANYQQVVATLEPLAKRDRSDETLLLNLATAYRNVGRHADAEALYRRVLMLEDVELDTATGGSIMSHDVARRALAARPVTLSQR
jgi:Flp pilus assembly protein TadD